MKTADIPRGLIVSCQAQPDSPFYGPIYMSAMAKAAEQGGALAVRVNGPADIKATSNAVEIPIIGIFKRPDLDPETYITPSLEEVRVLMKAGADFIAVDATQRRRQYGLPPDRLIRAVKIEFPELKVVADISTLDEGRLAADLGYDYVATTLSGYTNYSPQQKLPDLDLVEGLVKHVSVPIIAEGRYNTPRLVKEAFHRGAHAVVVGTAITNPKAITQAFVN